MRRLNYYYDDLINKWAATWQNKQNEVRPAKTQTSLGIHPVWSESWLSAWRKLGSLATHWAHSEDSDQTGRMPRLIWVFAGCTVTLLFFSCRGSNVPMDWIILKSWYVCNIFLQIIVQVKMNKISVKYSVDIQFACPVGFSSCNFTAYKELPATFSELFKCRNMTNLNVISTYP